MIYMVNNLLPITTVTIAHVIVLIKNTAVIINI